MVFDYLLAPGVVQAFGKDLDQDEAESLVGAIERWRGGSREY
jgi:hypothetical protein